MIKTFQYKAKINKQTEINAISWLNLCRMLYNLCLEQRIMVWKQRKKNLSKFDQINELPQFKKEFPEFAVMSSDTLDDVIARLDRAYQNFFRRIKMGDKPGFPRFKSRDRYDSFALRRTHWKLKGKYLYVKNIGKFRLYLSRSVEGKIKQINIRRNGLGEWFVSFICDEVSPVYITKSDKEIGIDVGLESFLTDSEGQKIENPRFFRKSEKELRIKNRSLSRKEKGSNQRKQAKRILAKCHKKIGNQRKDFINKIVNQYTKEYGVIYIEKLNTKGMLKNNHLSKSISDVAWNMFFNRLGQKAEEAAVQVVKVDPKYTSQLCSQCGEIVKKGLSVRVHKCIHCGLVLDRDENAALNILQRGRSVLSGAKLHSRSLSGN